MNQKFVLNWSKIKKIPRVFKGRPWVNGVIALVQIVVVIAAGYQLYQGIVIHSFDEFRHQQLVQAGRVSGGIQQNFEFLAGAMKALGKTPGIQQFDKTTTRRLLALETHELERFGVKNIGVLDVNGFLRYSARDHQSESKDFSTQKFYLKAKGMTSGDTFILQFISLRGPDAEQKRVLVAVPMFESRPDKKTSNFAGVVFCTLKLETVTGKFAAAIQSSRKGHAFLIDNNYSVLWASDSALFGRDLLKVADGFPSFQRILKKMAKGESGMAKFYYHQLGGGKTYIKEKSEYMVGYVPVKLGTKHWSLAVLSSKKDVKVLIRSTYLKQVVLVGIVILVILLGPAYSLAMAFRYTTSLEKQVRKKTKEISLSHKRLLTVLDSLDAAVYVVDMKTYEVLFINKHLRDDCGDVVGKICWQVLRSEKSGPCAFCTNKKLLTEDGKPSGVRVWEHQNSLTKKWHQIRDRAIPWVDGRIVKMQIASDISDRKAAEEKLRQTSEQLSSLLESLPIVPYTCEAEGDFGITYISNAVEDMTGYTPGKFLTDSKFWVTRIHPNDKKRVLSELPGIFKHNSLICDYSFRTADGSYKLISDTRTLIKESNGTVSHIAGIWQDITEKKKLEKDTLIRMYPRKRDGFGYIVGLSPAMQEVYKRVSKIIEMDVKTVLILGETGTGKDLVARSIHDLSNRQAHPFVEINCANIPENLLESELFGHEKGAFTDAKQLKRGLFEHALMGTVLLNEIGHMRLDLQAKLLRIVEQRTFRRVGGTKDLDIDVRILAATNRSLWKAVKNGAFRADLYYRIKLVPIHMPALRDRKEDIPLLIGHLLRKANREFKKDVRGFTREAEDMIMAYDWPGNVRELKNVIERAVILGDKNQIQIDHLPKEIANLREDEAVDPKLSENGLSLARIEKKMIKEALTKTGGNQVQAARLLELTRHAMRHRMKKHGFL